MPHPEDHAEYSQISVLLRDLDFYATTATSVLEQIHAEIEAELRERDLCNKVIKNGLQTMTKRNQI